MERQVFENLSPINWLKNLFFHLFFLLCVIYVFQYLNFPHSKCSLVLFKALFFYGFFSRCMPLCVPKHTICTSCRGGMLSNLSRCCLSFVPFIQGLTSRSAISQMTYPSPPKSYSTCWLLAKWPIVFLLVGQCLLAFLPRRPLSFHFFTSRTLCFCRGRVFTLSDILKSLTSCRTTCPIPFL